MAQIDLAQPEVVRVAIKPAGKYYVFTELAEALKSTRPEEVVQRFGDE